ncbi:MAG: GntR family transcriptional regulator, partial [Comamonadaceae bacterium]
MAPSNRINLSDKIRAALEAEITTGHLVAGSRIDEQALMDRFEVSRTPAREAILQLMSS